MKSIVPIDSKLGLWEASESGSSGWDRTNDLVHGTPWKSGSYMGSDILNH